MVFGQPPILRQVFQAPVGGESLRFSAFFSGRSSVHLHSVHIRLHPVHYAFDMDSRVNFAALAMIRIKKGNDTYQES